MPKCARKTSNRILKRDSADGGVFVHSKLNGSFRETRTPALGRIATVEDQAECGQDRSFAECKKWIAEIQFREWRRLYQK